MDVLITSMVVLVAESVAKNVGGSVFVFLPCRPVYLVGRLLVSLEGNGLER